MTVPWLLDRAPYLPFIDPRTARPPGLSPLDMAEWTVRHADFDAQMVRRCEVLAAHADIALGALGQGEQAQLELLSMLNTHLGDGPRALSHREQFCALTAIGNLVAEDFCLLLPDDASGEYLLVAAVLCFPSRWRLQEKIGRPLTMIHDPVPDYDETLARRVNRVFEVLRPATPLVRINWTIHATPELFLPLELSEKYVHEAGAAEPFYLRTERQTLVKLPETGAVSFGIKTSISRLASLRPAEAARLHGAVAALDADDTAYRGGQAKRGAVLAELAGIPERRPDT